MKTHVVRQRGGELSFTAVTRVFSRIHTRHHRRSRLERYLFAGRTRNGGDKLVDQVLHHFHHPRFQVRRITSHLEQEVLVVRGLMSQIPRQVIPIVVFEANILQPQRSKGRDEFRVYPWSILVWL